MEDTTELNSLKNSPIFIGGKGRGVPEREREKRERKDAEFKKEELERQSD